MNGPATSESAKNQVRLDAILRLGLCCAALLLCQASLAADEVRRNPFNDPLLQLTSGMANCPAPEVPLYMEQEFRNLAHERSQRGVSCWLAGRCRLHNSYLYDAEIAPRLRIAVLATSRYAETSVWALVQRRRVWLTGCVRTAAQAKEIEAIVRHIDDVEDVQSQLMVGTRAAPSYPVHKP